MNHLYYFNQEYSYEITLFSVSTLAKKLGDMAYYTNSHSVIFQIRVKIGFFGADSTDWLMIHSLYLSIY